MKAETLGDTLIDAQALVETLKDSLAEMVLDTMADSEAEVGKMRRKLSKR